MVQLQKMIAAGALATPAANRNFALLSHGEIMEVVYRNLSFHVPSTAFRDCALHFQKCSRERIAAFPYGSGISEEVFSFSGVPLLCPEGPALLSASDDGKPALVYRLMTVELSETERKALAPHLAQGRGRPSVRSLGVIQRFCNAMLRLVGLAKRQPPLHQNRFSMELCDSIRIQLQNFGLELSPPEFLYIFDFCSTLDLQHFLDTPGMAAMLNTLPPNTKWNDHFQLEEQGDGRCFARYRNLSVQFRSSEDVGIRLQNNATKISAEARE